MTVSKRLTLQANTSNLEYMQLKIAWIVIFAAAKAS